VRAGTKQKFSFPSSHHALLARVWPRIETLLKSHKLVNVYSDRLEGIR
jgi:hypothetical protein